MPSRRYFYTMIPVEHINGKLAPVAVKCPNTGEEEPTPVEGFFYGYRRKAQPTISRFGVRKKCRNLNSNPYTAAEQENRDLFTISLTAVYTNKNIAANWALCMADFYLQKIYKTPIGFAVAKVRENSGEWLDSWTA